jgi:hypothetical protein
VVAAQQLALVDPALGKFGVTVRAAVVHGDGLTRAVEPEDEILPEQGERLGAILDEHERDDGIPEFAEDGLAGDEHGRRWVKVVDLVEAKI